MRLIDRLNGIVGRFAMYLVFVIMGVLLYSSLSRTLFDAPLLWSVEVAQMTMAAYYLLGGGYSIQLDSHVRMDLLYARWSPKTKAVVDCITAVGLLAYLVVLLYGGVLQYAVRTRIQPEELLGLGTADGADQDRHDRRHRPDAVADRRRFLQGLGRGAGKAASVSYELIGLLMFSSMLVMLLAGQRVFGVIGFVATAFALLLWGVGGVEIPFSAAFKLFNWYPLLTLPLFIYMGYMLSESGLASDLYRAFHVWFGPLRGGLAIGTIGLMVVISAMNGLSVAGMAIGASIALPEMLKRGYGQGHDHRRSAGWQFPRHSRAAERGAGIVRHDRPAAGRATVVGWGVSRPVAGRAVRPVHRHPLSARSQARASAAASGTAAPAGGKTEVVAHRGSAAADFLCDDRPVPAGGHQLGRKFRGRCCRHHPRRAGQAPPDPAGARGHVEQVLGHQLYVYVDHLGGSVLRCGVRRAGRGQGDRIAVY